MATSVDVTDLSGKKVGSVDLAPEWFEAEVNTHVMHLVVTAQLAAARRGTASTKTRGEVRGGGRKPWRQKGTGRARHGSIRSPMWVGGGIAHGPKPREYTKRINKKVKRAALRSALSDRAQGGNVTVVRGLTFETPKTKDAVAALTALGFAEAKVLVVLADRDDNALRSFNNLQQVRTIVVDQLNTYDVVRSDVVVFAEEALELIGSGKRASTSGTDATPDEETAA